MEFKDIFVSYNNDGSGNQFAYRFVADLKHIGYSVYFNPYEQPSPNFPEKLRTAIMNCTVFILILSRGCLEQLMRNDSVDWVREELLTARQFHKNIIPILIEGTEFPRNNEDMPEKLKFLPLIDAIKFPENYLSAPFSQLLDILSSHMGKTVSSQAHTQNSNPLFNLSNDFLHVKQAAENGNVDAMYDLGMMYYYGATSGDDQPASRNMTEAYHWLSQVIDVAEDPALKAHAQSTVARLYYAGEVPYAAQSYEKAFQLDQSAAPLDDYSAANLGFMMRIGLGCDFNYDKIIDHYKTNIHPDTHVTLSLASFYLKYGKVKEAVALYDSLTYISPEADYRIGLIYRDGLLSDPPVPDPITAAYHFRNAADNHHALAAFEYGILCYRPTGRFRKNFKEAQKYLLIASDHGIADAQYVLGFMYEKGHVEKSLEKAVHYYEMAAQQGHSLAALELSKCYQDPACLDYYKAFKYAAIAASHGIGEAELMFGCLLLWGRGCTADVHQAIEAFTNAANHGIYYANVMLSKAQSCLTQSS